MAAQTAWRTLPVSHPSLPVLLVSVSFSPSSYSIHLTDLANIWSEELSKRDLVKRSMNEDTSIDIYDDPEQMTVFLKKLRSALDASHEEHHLSSLSLSTSKNDTDTLILRITCTLPAGLRPLKWRMFLKKAAPSALTTHLLFPLLQAQHVRAAESAALIAELKEKDAVIDRLADKIEAINIGWENVFLHLPSTGKRKPTRAIAEEKIKGLAKFSEANFYEKAKKSTSGDATLGNSKELIDEVFGRGEGMPYSTDFESSHEAGLDGWWKKLIQNGAVSLTERKMENTPKADTPPAREAKTAKGPSKDTDDFEIQDTPPHARSATKPRTPVRQKTVEVDDEETASEDDEDSPSQIPDSHPPPSAPKTSPPKKGKLVTIGGKQKQPTPPAKSPTPGPPKDVRMDDAGSDTASDSDSPPPPPKPAATPKRRLGALGGKRKNAEVDSPQSKTDNQEDSGDEGAAQKPATKPATRLGHIGKKTGSSPAAKDKDLAGETGGKQTEDEKSTARVKTVEQEPAETEEERANRRRAELERNTDKKIAAGPAKKKRKF